MLLLQGTDSLNRASQSIERSHRIAAETDQIGTDIIEELGEQREQLERTRSRVSRETVGFVPNIIVGTMCQSSPLKTSVAVVIQLMFLQTKSVCQLSVLCL